MDTKAKDSPITQKTLDLCQAITEQADFLSLKQKLDAFMADELVKFDYQQVNSLGNLLQSKQSNGVELTPAEVEKFEDLSRSFWAIQWRRVSWMRRHSCSNSMKSSETF